MGIIYFLLLFTRGGRIYGGSVKVGSFLHKNIWCEAVTERADMFALNLDCVVSGFMNL